MGTVRFGPGGSDTCATHYVQFKRLWSESWTTYTDAHCTDMVFACAPTMPTATIVWPYGRYKSHATNSYATNAKLDVSRWYVRVVRSDISHYWYGVVADVDDEQAGFVGTDIPSGQQLLHCYGLEQLLNQSTIDSSFVYNGTDDLHVTPLPITFNARCVGNKIGFGDGWVFNGIEVDLSATRTVREWCTADIVDYLLRYKAPSQSTLFYNNLIPFELVHRERLATLDHPVVHQEGMTPLAILNRLLDRRRLTSFRLLVDENTTPPTIQLDPFTFVADAIEFDLADVDDIPANDDTQKLIYEKDELTVVNVQQVDTHKVDRVTARGAHRTTTCTMFHTASRFEAGWTAAEETAYEAAASGEAGYGTWDSLKQQTRNQEVRAHESLRSVYSWFEIPDDWAGECGVYDSGTLTYDCFVDEFNSPVSQYIHGIVIEPYLPLYEGVDYSGAVIAGGSAAAPEQIVYRRPFVIFKRPTDGRFMIGERMSQLEADEIDPTDSGTNSRFDAHVRAQPESRIVEVNVTGEPQHAIAETDFSALAIDRDLGDYDYKDREMLVTLTVRECRYAEASYPDAGTPDSSLIDAQRSVVIWAGDEYRQDYVLPYTIVDVDDDGDPSIVTSSGFVRDDTSRLKAIARTAYEWYRQTRRVVTLTTTRFTTALSVGDMVTTVGDNDIDDNTHYQTINSPITQIRIRNPRLAVGDINAPTMTIITSSGELDPGLIVPPPKVRRRGDRA